MNFVEELKWRGMLHDIMPGTEELLSKGVISGYIGFDPSADSLHIGNLVQIMTLLHFQSAGHKPIALVGGATGMVGDPSGRSEERNLLDEKALQQNLAGIQKQLKKILNFSATPNAAEMVNNLDWFKGVAFLDFIRDVGKHITVSYMLAKDSVQNRLGSGMSFTEFSYQLVQGYDFYYLWKHKGVKLQLGGSDQWGNIVTGTELIRRKDGGEAFAITTQLIKKADGSKFGKSVGGNIWLDPAKTSPYSFYQFWFNTSDDDAKTYMRIFTLKDQKTIEALESEHVQSPHLRLLQKELAADITRRVHSEKDLNAAIEASEILFGRGTTESLKKLTEQDFLAVFEGVPQVSMPMDMLGTGLNMIDLLSEKTGIFKSKGEAKRMLQGGGVSINKNKVDETSMIGTADLLNGKYILAQKGKKDYHIITVT